jgi:predicted lipoprotein with Yx(FWY)xxD motif
VFGPQHYLPGGAGLEDEENKTAARNTAAAWATLLSDSASQKARSWSLLGDAMLIAGQPDEAARSFADVHRIQPKDGQVLQNYEIAKEQQTLGPFGDIISAATMIGRERPLTREDLQKIAVAPARPQPSEPVKAANTPKGEVLVDAKGGMTPYVSDRNERLNGVGYACDNQCESNWPPLIASDGGKPSGVWTFTVREDGKKQWAYKGKPLYFSKSDAKAGDVAGDSIGGNVWHPAAP